MGCNVGAAPEPRRFQRGHAEAHRHPQRGGRGIKHMIPTYIFRNGIICRYNYTAHEYIPVLTVEEKLEGLAYLYKEATGYEVVL